VLKAVEISKAAGLDIVCRLGGIHLLMSILGAIGAVMAGSGLRELLGLIYGANTVDPMLTGNAFARAVMGHLLVEVHLPTFS
jgi:hypothetical protein